MRPADPLPAPRVLSAADPAAPAPVRWRERLARALLLLYKRFLSPWLHAGELGHCCFLPTCSEYAYAAVVRHGLLRGGALAFWRLLRCHPFAKGGLDPVP